MLSSVGQNLILDRVAVWLPIIIIQGDEALARLIAVESTLEALRAEIDLGAEIRRQEFLCPLTWETQIVATTNLCKPSLN
jgi:antitoxin (DNA-binding transcriptional repressor) of toxin-antitoxin stability system